MLFNRSNTYNDINNSNDIKTTIYCAKKILPDFIFNMSSLENNPFTFPEVQTLLDGITVGGHRLSDEQQILDLKKSWELLFNLILKNEFKLDLETFNKIHYEVAKNEALVSGRFRDIQVRISGTEHLPPKAEDLLEVFNTELEIIKNRCDSNLELAIEIFLWGALNQFYYDGNKRTSRLMATGVLLSNNEGIMNIKAKDKLEFNVKMIEFYNTKEADNISEFIYNKCIERF